MPAHILMCPPDYYGIEYEINPWMSRSRQADSAVACQQWERLRHVLEECGAKISCLEPVRGLPDMVFTANAALIHGDMAVLSKFHHPERQGETPYCEKWFADHGMRIARLKSDAFFEGAGDALFCGDTLFAGYRIRSAIQSHNEIAAMFRCRAIALELVDSYFYHLDTCFCPLRPGVALYYPSAFDDYGRKVLRQWIPDLIAAIEAEAKRFACNAVVIGDTVVTNTNCPELHDSLRQRGFAARETPLDEFLKAGGAAKCLTLRLDGEDAAGWRTSS
jgi:N-dimethylarginine dimethylaminohydrolase